MVKHFSNNLTLIGMMQDPNFSEQEAINYLQYLATCIWRCYNRAGIMDGHCKSYDPLYIEKLEDGSYMAHSYIFDFSDGGRHHKVKSLIDIEEELMLELESYLKYASKISW